MKTRQRSIRLTFAEIGEPDLYCDVADVRWFSDADFRRIFAGIEGDDGDSDARRAVALMRASILHWNLTRDDGALLPLPKNAPRDAAGAVIMDSDPLTLIPTIIFRTILVKLLELNAAGRSLQATRRVA